MCALKGKPVQVPASAEDAKDKDGAKGATGDGKAKDANAKGAQDNAVGMYYNWYLMERTLGDG